MFSKHKAVLVERTAAAAEDRRRRQGMTETAAGKERRIARIYGRTSDQLARSFQDRVDTFVTDMDIAGETRVTLLGERHVEKSVQHHCFRDRSKTLERGRPYVSTKRVPVRIALGGGGALQRAKTAALPEKHVELDTVPRLRQPAYDDPKYMWRQRRAGSELGPPMRYAAKTENERIQAQIAGRPFASNSPWDQSANHPKFRGLDRSKWKGSVFDAINPPKDMRLCSITGDPPPSPITAKGEPFARPIVALLRERRASREVGPIFHPTVTRGRLVQSKSAVDLWGTLQLGGIDLSASRASRIGVSSPPVRGRGHGDRASSAEPASRTHTSSGRPNSRFEVERRGPSAGTGTGRPQSTSAVTRGREAPSHAGASAGLPVVGRGGRPGSVGSRGSGGMGMIGLDGSRPGRHRLYSQSMRSTSQSQAAMKTVRLARQARR